jgi:hypothetical protein
MMPATGMNRRIHVNPLGVRPPLVVVTGPPGSGKTRYCLERFVQAPEMSLVVFPSAAHRDAAEGMVRGHPRWSDELEFHLDSLQEWDRFLAYVLDHGNVVTPVIAGRIARVAVAARVSDQTPVGFFEKASNTLGFHERLAGVVGELVASGLTPERLTEAAGRACVSDERFVYKAESLAELWRAYCRLLERLGLTLLAEQPAKACDVISAEGIPAEEIWFDGFRDLTQLQLELLALLALERRVGLTLQGIGAGDGVFAGSRRLLDRLEERFELVRVDAAYEPDKYRSDTMLTLSRGLFQDDASPGPGDNPVWIIDCPNRLAEVEWAARWMLRLMEDEAFEPSDFVIVARDLETYRPLLAAVLPRFGFTPSWSVDRPASDNPFVRFLLSVLSMFRDDWPREAVYQHIASSYAFDEPEHWALRCALRGSRPRHGLGYWQDKARELEEAGCAPAERLRALTEWAHRFRGLHSPSEFASMVREMSTDLGWTARAADPSALGAREDFAAVDAADRVAQTLDQIESLGPESRMGLARFVFAWNRMCRLARFTLRSGPGVRVIESPDEINHPPRVAVLLGMVEGQFPRRVREDPFLNDEERLELRRITGSHLTTGAESVEDERLRFYLSVTLPTERLLLFYPRAGDEREDIPTLYLEEVRRALPEGAVKEQLITMAAPPSTGQPSQLAPPPEFALTPQDRLLAAASGVDGGIEVARRDDADIQGRIDGWAALPSFPRILLPEAVRLGGTKPGPTGVTELETMNRCMFQHWAQYRANVSPHAPGPSRADQGTLAHDVLRDALRARDGPLLPRLLEELEKHLDAVHLEGQDWELDVLRAWAVSVLTGFARREEAFRAAYGLTPSLLEWCFGEPDAEARSRDPSSTHSPLRFAGGGREVLVAGSVDRIDEAEGGALALDYKIGGVADRARNEMEETKSLQLPLYALAVEQHLGKEDVGVALDVLEEGKRLLMPPRTLEARFRRGRPPNGCEVRLLNDQWWRRVLAGARERVGELIERLERADVMPNPSPHTCGPCPYGDLCRTRGERRHDGEPWEEIDDPRA